jgi:aldehyde:ferredoxin oxidoreductase
MTLEDLLEIGERATNLARVFNARGGFTRQDDQLPDRLFSPLENGALEGETFPREEFETALTTLYKIKGWDPETGVPTRQKLESLQLGWAADLLD